MERTANPYNHIDLRVASLDAALPFYKALMPALGFTRHKSHREENGTRWEVFTVEDARPTLFFSVTEEADHRGNRNCTAFFARDRGQVDRVGQIVREAGGRNIEGPMACPEYGEGYYAVFFEDPSGNRLEVVNWPLGRGNISIRPLGPEDRAWVHEVVERYWGGPPLVTAEREYDPTDLPGLVAEREGERIGLLSYNIEGRACEIVAFGTLQPGSGVGTALIEAMKEKGRELGCERLWLITTNDNLDALRFYQKRGFRLTALHPDALERVREIKPTVPLIGNEGIPLRDMLELEMRLDGPTGGEA